VRSVTQEKDATRTDERIARAATWTCGKRLRNVDPGLQAVQRTRHLTVNGFVGIGMWRALGAGTGTYTPPVRGITRALFTST